jgi:acyl carrier protein
MSKTVRETISVEFRDAIIDVGVDAPTLFPDEFVLMDSGIDSMGFAILITKLEDILGYDPFTLIDEPFYPTTFGQLVAVYEQYSEHRRDVDAGTPE